MRIDGRRANDIRPIRIQRGVTDAAPGAVLIKLGRTQVLCTATVEEAVPSWRKESGLGWVTAEYDMLPGSTGPRRPRSRSGKLDGRAQEIQRLIGRSLRAVVDMAELGQRTIWLDCDVVQADGGTRTASIIGAYVAMVDAVRSLRQAKLVRGGPIVDAVAAVSVGLVSGRVMLDLCYEEDVRAEADFTVVMTGGGRFVEVQGAAEAGTFSKRELDRLLAVAGGGIGKILDVQRKALRAPARRAGRRV